MSIGHWILFCWGLAAYFLPGVVAHSRKHRNTMAIAALNLFLGWTGLGWVAAFVWALTNNVSSRAPSRALRPSLAPGGE